MTASHSMPKAKSSRHFKRSSKSAPTEWRPKH
jgi:hypothetical protein